MTNAAPTQLSLQVAGQLANGTLGDTGNALYFTSANTGPATAGIISGGNNIGGNYFSDRWGAPSSNFNPGGNLGTGASGSPQASSSGAGALGVNGTPYDAQGNYVGYQSSQGLGGPTGSGPGIGGGGSPAFASDTPSNSDLAAMGYSGTPADMSQDYGQDNPSPDISSHAFGQGVLGGTGNIAPGSTTSGDFGMDIAPSSGVTAPAGMDAGASADASGQGSSGGGLPGPLGSMFGGSGSSPLGNIGGTGGGLGSGGFGSQSPDASSSSQDSSGSDSSAGQPVDITDPHGIASIAGKSVQSGAVTLGKNIQDTGKAVDQTLNSDTSQLTQTANQDTTQVTNEATSLGNFTGQLLQNSDTGLLPRVGVGVVAIVLIGAALWMFGKE